jgi:beta-glucanase (GH16 family)
MSETVRLSVRRRVLACLALGTSALAGCSVKSSGLGAAKPYPADAPIAANSPDARNLDSAALGVDGAEGDDLPKGAGGAGGSDGGLATDGLAGLDGSVGVGGTVQTGGVRGGGGALGTGGVPGTGGGVVLDGALATGGEPGMGGVTSLGGAPGTGGALDAAADTGIRADAADLPDDAVAPDHAGSEAAVEVAADLRDARDARILADGRRDGVRVDVPSASLVWSDEFDAPANTGIDSTKWNYVTWPPGQVNNEKQRYTDSLNNVFHDGEGHLVLRARYAPNAAYPYTSGRIDTSHKVSFGPGHRVEVRAKLPAGGGSFPGIVMMGTSGSWPTCGQLSLMEQYGQDKSLVYAAVYAGSASGSGSTDNTPYAFPDATAAGADFHVYSLDWYSDHVDFWVDGDAVLSSDYAKTSPLSNITEYVILDLALGGDMGGVIDNDAFPMDMVIDYVRVYEL